MKLVKEIETKRKRKIIKIQTSVPRSGFKSERTRSAFAAAEWKAVLALETKEGASIPYAARVEPMFEI